MLMNSNNPLNRQAHNQITVNDLGAINNTNASGVIIYSRFL